jgi:hypothetical protein
MKEDKADRTLLRPNLGGEGVIDLCRWGGRLSLVVPGFASTPRIAEKAFSSPGT